MRKILAKQFEMSNHLGNVITVVSDRKIPVESTSTPTVIDYYLADVLSTSDYYPFGMLMPGRHASDPQGYRYGFNGKEMDDEIKGAGNSLDFGARIYDSRLGRWLSVDGAFKEYVSFSPYLAFANNPINFVDDDGNLLRDKDGNLIVVKNGASRTAQVPMGGVKYIDPKTQKAYPVIAMQTAQDVFVFSNKGEKIKATLYTGEPKYYAVGKNGQLYEIVDQTWLADANKQLDPNSNCHGTTCGGDGKLWISPTEIGDELLNEAEFKTTDKNSATVVVYDDPKIKMKAAHSATKKGDSYTVDDGIAKTKYNATENEASGNGKYTNPQYKTEVQTKVSQTKGIILGKLRIFDKESDVKKKN